MLASHRPVAMLDIRLALIVNRRQEMVEIQIVSDSDEYRRQYCTRHHKLADIVLLLKTDRDATRDNNVHSAT